MTEPAAAPVITDHLTTRDFGFILRYLLPDWLATEHGITEELAGDFLFERTDPQEADELLEAINAWRFGRGEREAVAAIVQRIDLFVCDGCLRLRPCRPFPDTCDALCSSCTEERMCPREVAHG